MAAPDQDTIAGRLHMTHVRIIHSFWTNNLIFHVCSGGSYYHHFMRDAGLSIKAWLDINDNDYDKVKDVLNAYVKWVNLVQHKSDPNNIDVRIGKQLCSTFYIQGGW